MIDDCHYLLFIHGVNTRERRESPQYADHLFDLITSKVKTTAPNAKLVKMAFYWGDVGQADEDEMMAEVKASPIFEHFHLKDVRENQLQQFIGDAALYISRTCGAKVVQRIYEQAQEAFSNFNPAARNHLHLVSHSWGTVILLDALFADRWDDENAPGHDIVQEIRRIIFGLSPASGEGLFVRSIHTMGSPIAMFSLMEKVDTFVPTKVAPLLRSAKTTMSVDSIEPTNDTIAGASIVGKTHDITDHLKLFLETLHADAGAPLPWNNYAHPGDLVAYPLEVLLPSMLENPIDRLTVSDFLVEDAGPKLFEDVDPLAIIRAGDAHASYWQSNLVAEKIAAEIIKLT